MAGSIDLRKSQMLYCKPWTVFGDNIKGLNSKCDDDGSCIIQLLSDNS